MHYYHQNQDLHASEEAEDTALAAEEARRRAINPFLGGMPHELTEARRASLLSRAKASAKVGYKGARVAWRETKRPGKYKFRISTYRADDDDKEESLEGNELEEGVSGSAWMFYNHYNPELTKAMQCILVGERIEDVINSLFEKDEE
jgi:hypothetical protein